MKYSEQINCLKCKDTYPKFPKHTYMNIDAKIVTCEFMDDLTQ